MNNAINENERNLIIYGHRNKYGLMFEDLIKYQYEEFWKNHATIRFTTEMNDEQYMIFAVVKTKVYYQNENGVFKYYNFAKINNEDEYYKYIDEMKKLSLYKTNVSNEILSFNISRLSVSFNFNCSLIKLIFKKIIKKLRIFVRFS